jgi:cytochrome c biogenesis factor
MRRSLVRVQVGPLNLKNMKKIKDFFKSFVAVMIVMLGAYLLTFYMKNEFSFTSVFAGIIGFLIIFPAIKKWEQTLWGTNAKEDQINAK